MADRHIVAYQGAESKGVCVEKTEKGEWRHRRESLTVFEHGIRRKIGGVQFVPNSEDRKPRGDISGFSRRATARLRESLLSTTLKGGECDWFGVTLTLPWDIEEWGEEALEDFRRAWNHFGVSIKRLLPSVGWLFRVELQKRGAPHIHAIMYAPFGSDWLPKAWRTDNKMELKLQALKELLTSQWGNCVSFRTWTERAVVSGFDKRGVKVESIANHGAVMRYLLDHTSKRKQAQLGYRGKQWGYLNRKALSQDSGTLVNLPDRARALFNRATARLCRFRLKDGEHAKAPFGSHKSKPLHGAAIRFIRPCDVRRLLWWAVREAESASPDALKSKSVLV